MKARGLKHGAVEDKLGLPGLQKLSRLAASDFFGRVVGFRIEFGWWVFDGTEVPCQRPSWNYRKKDGGGLILDMYPHWRYVIENTLGPMRRVITAMSTATPERIDERGARYDVDVEDNASTLIELESGAIGTILSSWATRVRRDDLLTFQIDGTKGSAIAGLHRCWTSTQRADAAHRAFQHRHRSQRRLSRQLARGDGRRAVQEPLSHRLGEFPAPRRRPARRCRPISPPASATCSSPRPATAA